MTKEDLKKIFQNSYNRESWQEVLQGVFGVRNLINTPNYITGEDNKVVDGCQLGWIDDGKDYKIGIFEYEIKSKHNIKLNRVGLRSMMKGFTKFDYDAVLTVFYSKDGLWRLSFISDIHNDSTPPKRYTYVFGDSSEKYRTASERFSALIDTKPTYGSIKDAFSVEALNKEFFNGYIAQYKKFVGEVERQRGGDKKMYRDYVKKLLGRLVFIQFLQKKGWMGVPASNTAWAGGDPNYIENLIYSKKGDDKLLTNVLELLFFETLNKERTNDIADEQLGKNIRIPYLNGGLFDKDDVDKQNIDFPYELFEELMQFFSLYNFTIDENDPYDAEVGVDPEMLGHIFENLLEDNKDKGAFYTPKEIVKYMCQQSLIEYLKSHTDEAIHSDIEKLINIGEVAISLQVPDIALNIDTLLQNVKVCDPAIGSGAFPMGILGEIFHARQRIFGFTRKTNFSLADIKREIIQNSIFGVDIEKGAVDIARLRFWLSLVVDEERPVPLPNLDYKIMCGNSLLSRYALDLPLKNIFDEYNRGKSTDEKLTLSKYKDLVAKYTDTSDHTKKDEFRGVIEEIKKCFKTELGNKDKNKIAAKEKQIKNIENPSLFGDEKTKTELAELKKFKKELVVLLEEKENIESNQLYKDAFEWRFEFPALLDDEGNFLGFDIVIGNPPYGVSIKGNYRKTIEKCLGKVPDYEIYYYFIQKAQQIIRERGILSYIIPNTYLFNTFANKYRTSILEEWGILEILDCSRFCIFESATVRNTINTWQKSSSKIIGYRNTSNVNSFSELLRKPKLHSSKDELLAMNQNWGLAFMLDEKKIKIIKKIKDHKSLEYYFPEISQGLIAYDKYRGQSDDIISNRTYHHSEYRDDLKKWLWGADVNRYRVEWNTKEYIDYCEGIANPRHPKFFNGKRILIREITNPSIYVAITSDEMYNDPSIIVILDNCKYSIETILAILNSKLGTFFHFNHAPKASKGAFPKILIKDIKEFPIPEISNEVKDCFEKSVIIILELKKDNPQADTSALESEIDQMVYKLYNLTEDEIAIIENR